MGELGADGRARVADGDAEVGVLDALAGNGLAEAIERTVFDGIAKPTPSLPPESLWICAFTPITCAVPFRSGPPELPWLIGASVWIAFGDGEVVRRRGWSGRAR